MKFGIPRVITSDQGREFNNDLNRRMMELMGIEHRLATPYHPQVWTTDTHAAIMLAHMCIIIMHQLHNYAVLFINNLFRPMD